MWQKFNVNNYIRFKPNNRTDEVMKQNWDNIFGRTPYEKEWEPVKRDEEGFVEMQMWAFMAEFGPYLSLGSLPPFETEIMYEVKDAE